MAEWPNALVLKTRGGDELPVGSNPTLSADCSPQLPRCGLIPFCSVRSPSVKIILLLVIMSVVAWRYRRILGMPAEWDRFGSDRAEDLAAKMGWSRPTAEKRPGAVSSRPVPASSRSGWGALLPNINGERLPATLAVGVLDGVIAVGLDVQGFSILSTIVGMVVAPFLGGVYLRSKWWMLVAPFVAFVTGSAGEFGTLISAVPVAAIAYAGIKTDLFGWLARMNAGDRASGT
jgi:hypothetical protein